MKKIVVPAAIVILLIIFVIILSNGKGRSSRHVDRFVQEPESEEISKSEEDDFEEDENVVTIIGSPDSPSETKTESKVASEIDMSCLELARLTVTKPEQILSRTGYITSYNNKTKNANWVAWHLTKEHTTGPWSRDGIPYSVDTDVNGARQELEDWFGNNLPIDHGHMCPAGDNKWSEDAMVQTFLLTNMCPQNSALNRGDWEELESRCRGWANHYGEVYIVCGPIFYRQNYKTIGDNKVGVPDAFYKVVLRMGKKPQALGFIYPNDGTHHKMSYYVLSVDDVESRTGIDFFYNLPDDIENEVESSSNLSRW